MKKSNLLILFMSFFTHSVMSQTASGTITQAACNNDGIYSVSTTGLTLPITYEYYINGNLYETHSNINSATDQLINIPMLSGYIQVKTSDGTQLANSSFLSFSPSFNFGADATSAICPSNIGVLNAYYYSGTTGPYTYSWENVQTTVTYPNNNASAPMGDYLLTILDQTTGCVMTTDTVISINQVSNIAISMSSTPANCTDGTATATPSGGTAPYSYLWMNGATSSTISGLSTSSCSVVITDVDGCISNTNSTFVSQTTVITINTSNTDATCLQSDGSSIAFASGGTAPYTYSWNNGQTGNTAVNLTVGNYRVYVTDANGCTKNVSAFISGSTPVTSSYSAIPSDCNVSNGSATVTPNGGTAPYSIQWNTFPVTTGPTISNFPTGSYPFTITDAVGCVRTGTANIGYTSFINVNLSGAPVTCPNTTGDLSSSVNGSNPPFSYLWSNGATTSQITGVALGSYSCEITDDNGCTTTSNVTLSGQTLLNINITTTPVSCVYNADGAASAQVTGGTAPYTYSYSSGSTSANETTLETGGYWLTVTDANGCSKARYFSIDNANTATDCYCTISGNVYVDDNTNCTLDGGESGIENIMIHCTGYGYVYTDANGDYSFQVPTGTYTITQQTNQNYSLTGCQSASTTVSVVAAVGCNTIVNIANDENIITDLRITTVNSSIPPVPGNNYQQKIIIENVGTTTESNIQLGYEHDGQLSYSNSSSANLIQTGGPRHYAIQTGFPSLTPNSSSVILVNYDTPTNIPIGTEVVFHDSVANMAPIDVNWLLDNTPWNNVNQYSAITIASYDPNYKEVYPKGIEAEGYVSSETTEFNYTIHFQNEGTYYAQNIYITDQLDADLDWTTLSPGYSDYSYTTTVSETGLVTFTFANINLPWKSQYGDLLSSGLVSYSIKRNTGLPQGTEFTNTADIYFDYNDPITTNTTLNTLNDTVFLDVDQVENNSIKIEAKTMDVYPVPATDIITIRVNNILNNEIATLYVIDLLGNIIQSEKISLSEGSNMVTQNISALARGTYLTQVRFENGTFLVKKIIVQ